MLKIVVLTIVALIACLFIHSSSQAILQTQFLYQGTNCSTSTANAIYTVTREITAQCNVTQCTAYTSDPALLSRTYECPTTFPSTSNLADGKIQIVTYTDAGCTTVNKVELYATNVCMQSNIIFGPSAKSAKYTCNQVFLYSDASCTNQISASNNTLNSCTASKTITTCKGANPTKSNGAASTTAVFTFGLLFIIAFVMSLF
ncbi:hypothetical protein ABK040_001392 [Willaertia magna]